MTDPRTSYEPEQVATSLEPIQAAHVLTPDELTPRNVALVFLAAFLILYGPLAADWILYLAGVR